MERAKILMATDGTLHSYEIAERVGLGNNPHYFSQVFRKYTGMTAKEYRVSLEEAAGSNGGRRRRNAHGEGNPGAFCLFDGLRAGFLFKMPKKCSNVSDI